MRHCLLFLILLCQTTPIYAAAKITLVNSNGQCSGFNDPTPTSGTGGNYGMTLGQQRLNAFQYAANLIGQHLVSNINIRVDAQMNSLGGSEYSAILGQAGPMSVVRDFSGAPYANTYYPIALAESLYGGELNGGDDIVAEFNSDLDNATVLGSYGWYYGFSQGGGGNIDFVTVIQHELLHGLGFLNLLDANGAKFYGRNDSFLLHLEGHAYSPASLHNMTDNQRANAMVDNGNLHWIGPQVTANSGSLNGGVDGNNHVFMYAPSDYRQGSSVSHFSNLVSPNEGMEPFYTGPDHTPGLALYVLKDIGWNITSGSGNADLHLALSDSGNHALGDNNTYTVTVTNNGSSTAVETVVTYMIPYGHSYVSATPSAGTCYQANRIITCALGDITQMGTANIDIVARMNAAGSHTHSAIASSASNELNYSDNRVYKSTSVIGESDISLNISPQSGTFTQGSNYTYTASISNNGASAVTNLALQVSLPTGLTFVESGTGSCCATDGSNVQCHVPELNSKSNTEVSFTVNAGAVGSYASSAFVSQNQTDPDSTNNNVSLDINIQEEEKDECFIATAAFGSLMHREVKWLRRFRDEYLLTNSPGKQFVRLYYRLSPPLANRLRQHEILRAITRGSLGPIVALSRWLIKEDNETD